MPVDLDAALEQVMGQCRADAVELFLTLPSGSDVVLAAQVGLAERAFRERTRFARGEGFPGLVAAAPSVRNSISTRSAAPPPCMGTLAIIARQSPATGRP